VFTLQGSAAVLGRPLTADCHRRARGAEPPSHPGRRYGVSRRGPLFYSPSLMRAFNFSFTSSVTPTFNNTPCARQKFAPGNHGFDHKTAAGRSWLTLSALQAVWSRAAEIRWKARRLAAGTRSRPLATFLPHPKPQPPLSRYLGVGKDSQQQRAGDQGRQRGGFHSSIGWTYYVQVHECGEPGRDAAGAPGTQQALGGL
jgi:hypothetical protein